MKNVNIKNGCSGCVNALVFVPALGVGVMAMGNEKFNRKMAQMGQIDSMIATIEPSFRDMVPSLDSFKANGDLDGNDLRRFATAHEEQKDWQLVRQTALLLADVVDYGDDSSVEGKVKYLTAIGRVSKTEVGIMAADMYGTIKTVQDWQARLKWGDEQWRMETKELVNLIVSEKKAVDEINQKSFLLSIVGSEKGRQIREMLPQYSSLASTYTFESGMAGDDVTVPLNELHGKIKDLLEGSSLEPRDILNMINPDSNVELYTAEIESIRTALRNVDIIN